jgi:hypothetical protein
MWGTVFSEDTEGERGDKKEVLVKLEKEEVKECSTMVKSHFHHGNTLQVSNAVPSHCWWDLKGWAFWCQNG